MNISKKHEEFFIMSFEIMDQNPFKAISLNTSSERLSSPAKASS